MFRPLPLGPLTLTVNCPAPAPRVSHINLLWKIANTPCSMPGPYTRTLLASGAPLTRTVKGLPGTSSPRFLISQYTLIIIKCLFIL